MTSLDIWNGNGNWTANPGDWSAGVPTSSDTAIIQTGPLVLNTTGAADFLTVAPGASLSLSDATLTTTANIANLSGSFSVDTGSSGDSVTVGGILDNPANGVTTIGYSGLSASTTVKAASLVNTGSLTLQGASASATTDQATLDITGAAPAMLTGANAIRGDADLEFGSGAITSLATQSTLEIDGAQARVSIGAGTTSSALSGLADVYNGAELLLQGHTGSGAGGTSLATTVGLTNSGSVEDGS